MRTAFDFNLIFGLNCKGTYSFLNQILDTKRRNDGAKVYSITWKVANYSISAHHHIVDESAFTRKIAQKHSPNKLNNKMNNSRRRRGDPELVTQVNCSWERRPHQTTIAICQKYILCSTIVDIARSAAISFCKLTQTDSCETENIRLSICFGFRFASAFIGRFRMPIFVDVLLSSQQLKK